MPWWSWILIWSALVVAAAAFFALVGWRVFRTLMAVLREAGTAASALSLHATPIPGADASAGGRTSPEPGIFQDPVLARTRYEEGKEMRRAARRERRITRRQAAGQPRALRDFPGL